jgi:ABC-type transporter lipoprotein component MlaA
MMIANAFDNLTVVPRVVNNLLQGKWNGAGREVAHHEQSRRLRPDSRQVGHRARTVLVLPFMEPLTVQDRIGKVIDRTIDPLTAVRNGYLRLREHRVNE